MTRDGLLTLIGNTLAIMVAFTIVWVGVGRLLAFMRRLIATTPTAQTAPPAAQPSRSVAQEPRTAQKSAAHAPDYGAWAAAQAAPSLDWLREMNDKPSEAPHLAAVGPSGSGKSTLILAALTRRPGQIVITTPKSVADDPWGGFPAVRSAFDENYQPSYKALGAAWQAVYLEMNKRHADPSRPRTPLTLVADELTTCFDELRGMDPQRMFIRMWLMGRSVNVRLITMDPTMNVKGWGIEGRGDVRESILFVRAERDKSARFFEWDAQKNRPFNERPFDTAQVLALAAQGLDGSRVWVPEAAPPAAQEPAQPTIVSRFSAPRAREVTPHETELVRMWYDDGETSLRALARQLYKARGGDDESYKGDGDVWYAVKAVLEGVADEAVTAA